MCNLEEYTVCEADSEEWGRYHAIYRLSNFNEWMPLSFQGEIDRYKKVDFCYWVIKDNKRIGGAFIKPNMLKCVFVIPPFNNKRILIEKLSLYVDSISDRNEDIEVSDADLKSIKDYESFGYKLKIINKLMVCATNTFDVDWEEEYKVINPKIEHSEDMAQLYYETYSKSNFSYISSQSYDFQVSSVNVYFDHIRCMNVPNDWSTLIYHTPTKKLIAACIVGLVNGLPYILDFVVHPKFQRKGLATKMMKRILNLAAGNYPAIRLNVTVGNDAEIFYNELGFISLAENIQMKKLPL
ncbi:GNAT family N-acetyltransferase [Clostridium frigidicarnis]|uniref:Acetyltransferase (GNAT) domain-containing protein n=1 Tax=Clostridium frigidicarnis TaxID=84698 RepID=A0A1I0Y4G6_9CLOT|nr:GNAT family N-acetyltransferase [Clostridium frigidicarnis]SFB08082.1 Acetyltransferase (GNAT) domain-containing protein [Clostridium frigidicarnis]